MELYFQAVSDAPSPPVSASKAHPGSGNAKRSADCVFIFLGRVCNLLVSTAWLSLNNSSRSTGQPYAEK